MKFELKPVIVEAWRASLLLSRAAYGWNELPQQVKKAYENGDIVFGDNRIFINSPDGAFHADLDDMVICGESGMLHTCKPDIFFTNYREQL